MVGLRFGAALLLALGLGCSGDGAPSDAARQEKLEATFEPAFQEVSEQYRASMADVQGQGRAALESQDRQKVLDVYRALGDAAAESAKRFSALTPPARVEAQFNDLIANLEAQRKALDRVVAAAKAEQDGPLTEGLGTFSELLVEFGTIQESITAAVADE